MNNRVVSLLSLLLAHSAASVASFELLGTTDNPAGGFVHPAMLVGFNPQPEPPAGDVMLDLMNPPAPVITSRSTEYPPDPIFEFVIGLTHPEAASMFTGFDTIPSPDGLFEFGCAFDDGSSFMIRLTLISTSPINRFSWTAFNPQPEPPAFPGALGFSFTMMTGARGDAEEQSVSVGIEVFNGDNRVSWEIPAAPTAVLAIIAAVPMVHRRRRALDA